MKIVTLLARHGTERYADAVQNVETWYAEHLPDVEHDLVISDNALPEAYAEPLGTTRVLIGASNAHWEFSAWDRAITYLGGRIEDYDLVHLATSAFRRLELYHLEWLDASRLECALGRKLAIGNVDYFDEPIALQHWSAQAWLRSSWIFLPPRELLGLGSLVSISNPERFFSGKPDAPFRSGAPISANFQRYIVGYLTGGRPEVKWHSQFQLNSKTLAYFQAKTVAILNEHMLSIRLSLQGCDLVDATWLATRQALTRGRAPDVVPDWRWQVAVRQLVLNRDLDRLSAALRASLIVGETWAIARSHGTATARQMLLGAVVRDPRLILERPVLGAVRRCVLQAA